MDASFVLIVFRLKSVSVINHPCRFGGISTFDLLRGVSVVALVSYNSLRSFQRVRQNFLKCGVL